MLKTFFLLVILTTQSFASQIYQGSFTQIEGNDPRCTVYFNAVQYSARFHITGMTGHTAVLHLESEIVGAKLHGLNQVGLLGPDGDFKVSTGGSNENARLELTATGIADYEFILFTQEVRIFDNNGTELCNAKADYSGFMNK